MKISLLAPHRALSLLSVVICGWIFCFASSCSKLRDINGLDLNLALQILDNKTQIALASQLRHSAASGDLEEVIQLMLQVENMNSQGTQQRTALHWVARLNHVDVVKVLLANEGINPNVQDENGNTALHLAVRYNNLEIIEMLSQNTKVDSSLPNNDGNTVLCLAVQHNSREKIVKIVLYSPTVNPNIPKKNGNTALHSAVQHNYEDVVEMLLGNAEVDSNIQNQCLSTALHLAARNNYVDFVKKLLKNKKTKLNIKDDQGNTALYWAVQCGHQEIVEMLSQQNNKVDPNEVKKIAYISYNTGIVANKKHFIQRENPTGCFAMVWKSVRDKSCHSSPAA